MTTISAPADTGTRLAVDRTRLAYKRTMMAWVRTGTSLISFGFTIYKFFQLQIEGKVDPSTGRRTQAAVLAATSRTLGPWAVRTASRIRRPAV